LIDKQQFLWYNINIKNQIKERRNVMLDNVLAILLIVLVLVVPVVFTISSINTMFDNIRKQK